MKKFSLTLWLVMLVTVFNSCSNKSENDILNLQESAESTAEKALRFEDKIKQYSLDSETLKAIRAFYKLYE